MRFGLHTTNKEITPLTGDFRDQFTKLTKIRKNGKYKHIRPASHCSEITFVPKFLDKSQIDTPTGLNAHPAWKLNLNLNVNLDVSVVQKPKNNYKSFIFVCSILAMFVICFVVVLKDFVTE